jgi:ribosomal protein L16 Arg81 hydroxylase
MSAGITSFEALLAPMDRATFERDYLDRRPAYIEGGADKFRAVMNWQILNRLLGMTTIWSHQSLKLVFEKEPVPASEYATPAPGRDGGQVLRPDPERVRRWLARGATLVANDIDQLTPELSTLARVMEEALGGKVQANLYLSSRKKQGFRVHYDTHDVFAIHCEGEKTWFVFEGRAEVPIAHPMFKNVPQEVHERQKGALWREIRMKPGDLLYLPRGQYHYALADEGGCVHIALGVTYPIGLDVLSYLFERMVAEPLARHNLPRGDDAALAARLSALGDRIAAMLREEKTLADMRRFLADYRWPRGTYDLPELLDAARLRYRVSAERVRLVTKNGQVALVDVVTRQGVPVPSELVLMTQWVLARQSFDRGSFDQAFASDPPGKREKFLKDMEKMAILRLEA